MSRERDRHRFRVHQPAGECQVRRHRLGTHHQRIERLRDRGRGSGDHARSARAACPTPPANRPARARAPVASPPAWWTPARARAPRRRAPRSPRPGSASAAWPTSRRGRPPALRAASSTSVCASSARSRAILPRLPAAMPSARREIRPAGRAARARAGRERAGRASRRALRPPRCRGPPSAASVPAAPPNCSTSASSKACASRTRPRDERVGPARRLEPEGDRRGVLEPRAPRLRRIGVPSRQRDRGRGGAQRGPHESSGNRGADLQHEAGVDDVLAGRTPVHVARGGRIGRRRPCAVSISISGMAGLPACARPASMAPASYSSALRRLADRRNAARRYQPFARRAPRPAPPRRRAWPEGGGVEDRRELGCGGPGSDIEEDRLAGARSTMSNR